MLVELSDSVNLANYTGAVLSDSDLLLKDSEALEVPLGELLMFTLLLTCEK